MFLKEESNSISNQRKLIMDYIMHKESLHGIETLYYIDDGYSGTTFVRPGFKAMMEDIKKINISCIIVKDLSRLGRDYIEIGYYLEEVFPVMGVRFIAINDFYDTAVKSETANDLAVCFKNVINDFYCKDISRKIKATIRIKQENGDSIGGPLIYGYRRDKDVIIADQSIAEIIKRIFHAYNAGKSAAEIAKELNKEEIDSPSFYMDKIGIRSPSVKNACIHWNGSTVLRILRNEVYTGVLLYRKTESIDPTANWVKKYEENEWLRIEGKLPQIISKEEFELASSKKRKRSKNKYFISYPKKYVGIIKCGCCNHNLTWRLGKKEQEIYYCRHYNFTQHDCNYVKITEQELDGIVENAIKVQIAAAIDIHEVMEHMAVIYQEKLDEIERKLHETVNKIRKCKKRCQMLYDTYVSENMDKKVFLNKKEQIEKLLEMSIREEKICKDKKEKMLKEKGKIPKLKDITKAEINLCVKEIIYYDYDSIEIKWNFRDEFNKVQHETEHRCRGTKEGG